MDDSTQASRPSGKMPLTDDSVARVARAVLGPERTGPRAQRLKQDWRAFLRSEFRLSRAQQGHLRSIPAGVVAQVQRALGEAVDGGGRVEVRLASATEPGELTVALDQGGDEGAAQELTINFLNCKFDADCGNWQCKGPSLP